MTKLIAPVLAALLLAACTSEAPKAQQKKAKAPPELIGAQSAFFRILGPARTWAQDLQVLRMEPVALPEMKEKDGKWPAWRVQLVSASRGRMKTYSYSVLEAEGIHEGVYGSNEESFAGPRGQTIPFLFQAFKTDSPAALETALKKGADYIKKHPDMPVTMVLEKAKTDGNPNWRVIWGTSVAASNFSIYIDATNGEYMKTMH